VGLNEKRDEGDLNEYPKDLREDHRFLSVWVSELAQKYKNQITIELINASSFRGFLKSVRHWTQTYPTFIVNKKEKYVGKDKEQLDRILQSHLDRSGARDEDGT